MLAISCTCESKNSSVALLNTTILKTALHMKEAQNNTVENGTVLYYSIKINTIHTKINFQ